MTQQLFIRIGEFSVKTFPDATPIEHLKKLQIEAEETIKEPTDRVEYADCLISLFAAAYKAGISLEELLNTASDKVTICEGLKFVRLEDGTYQSIK